MLGYGLSRRGYIRVRMLVRGYKFVVDILDFLV